MSDKPHSPLIDIHPSKPLHRVEDATREEKLHRALRDWKATFNAINDQICLLDRDGTILQCNESMSKLLNLTEDQIVGRKCHELMHSSNAFFQGCPYREMLRTRKREGFELSLDDKCYMVTADPIFGEAGEITGAVHIIRDVTFRKRAEDAYRIDEKRLRSVLKITQHRPESLRELLDGALEEAIALSDSKLGYIYYYSEEKKEFTLHAWSRDVMEQCNIPNSSTVYRLEETGLWGEAVRQRRPIVVNDFLAPNLLKKGYPEGHSPLFRYMTLPVFSKGEVVAVVGMANKVTDYTDLDVRQLALMMDSIWEIAELKQIELALQKSEEAVRQLPGKLLIAQEAERRLLAREMHDDLTQRLAVLAIEAGKLEQELDLSGTAPGRLRDMKEQLIKLSEDVHTLSRQLHPSILDDLGLVDALRSECSSFSQREGIAVRCTLEPAPANLPTDIALCLYRIAQEGLRNIAKHADVKEATISLASTEEGILLSVEDEGFGFDPAQFHGKPGLGLVSMEERARLIGGDFSLRSKPGKGTLIEVWAPLGEIQ